MAANHARYSRFEKARIVGARALQIAMGAPVLIELAGPVVNPVDVSLSEFSAGVIPITVKRAPPPKQQAGRLFMRRGAK